MTKKKDEKRGSKPKFDWTDRPNWDEDFMMNALQAATRATCYHVKTGAVLVRENRIIASGYNGAPSGIRNCFEVGCRKQEKDVSFGEKERGVCRGTHAEMNALNQVSRWDLRGTSLYSVLFPCSSCAKAIVSAGIEEVVYFAKYCERDSLTQELFREAGVKLRIFELDIEKNLEFLRRVAKNSKK